MPKKPDLVILGGGVIGLSIAYLAALRGLSVTVLDRCALGQAASRAGAGIIAAPATLLLHEPEVALRSRSALLHAAWAQELHELTGIDNGYTRCGSLDIALAEEELEYLESTSVIWAQQGIPFQRLDSTQARSLEPALSHAILAAWHLPDRAQIRNPWHLKALIRACELLNVRLRPNQPVISLNRSGRRARAIVLSAENLEFGNAVLAAGAWSEALLEPLGLDLPTTPIKGQIALLRTEPSLLKRIIERGDFYLVPRRDGRLLVGATEEQAGFDIRPTASGVQSLLQFAITICPGLAHAELETAWAGLRPSSIDGRPYLGPAPGFDNLFIATGHFRAGLQLSTGSAELIVDLITGRAPRFPLDPFLPGRAPAPSASSAAFRS